MPNCDKCGTCYCRIDGHDCKIGKCETVGAEKQYFKSGINVTKEVASGEPDQMPEMQAEADGLPETIGEDNGEVPTLQPPKRASFRRDRK